MKKSRVSSSDRLIRKIIDDACKYCKYKRGHLALFDEKSICFRCDDGDKFEAKKYVKKKLVRLIGVDNESKNNS